MSHFVSVRLTQVLRAAAVFAALLALLLVGSRADARSHHYVTRLHFPQGRSRLVVLGFLDDRQGERDYTFAGKAGQRFHIAVDDIRPPDHKRNDALVTLYHLTFPSGKQFGQKGYDPFDGRLTETGTYRITVGINEMATNARRGRFRMILTRSCS